MTKNEKLLENLDKKILQLEDKIRADTDTLEQSRVERERIELDLVRDTCKELGITIREMIAEYKLIHEQKMEVQDEKSEVYRYHVSDSMRLIDGESDSIRR